MSAKVIQLYFFGNKTGGSLNNIPNNLTVCNVSNVCILIIFYAATIIIIIFKCKHIVTFSVTLNNICTELQ